MNHSKNHIKKISLKTIQKYIFFLTKKKELLLSVFAKTNKYSTQETMLSKTKNQKP